VFLSIDTEEFLMYYTIRKLVKELLMSPTENKKSLQLRPLSSLAKVFPQKIFGKATREAYAVSGQEVSFQIAFRRIPEERYRQRSQKVKVVSPFKNNIKLYTVGNVPSVLSAFPDERSDDDYITKKSGIFPDPLIPVKDDSICAASCTWRSLWVSVKIPEDCPTGEYKTEIKFINDKDTVQKVSFRIKVKNQELPKQKLLFTQWFHCDCIADVHNVPIFSEEHWTLIGKYMRLAADHGMNTILTPVVTPPLDTAIGGERPTVQLVDITRMNGKYSFDSSKLERYIKLALDCGLENFEISHLFTQWGARFAPKVMATTEKGYEKIFGWETDAINDESYAEFLRNFVPFVISTFEKLGIERNRLLFHVSDEPRLEHIEAYKKAQSILFPLVDGCRHIDALSPLEFYTQGLVESPVVATNRIEPYLDAGVKNLWCYYCCSQGAKTSNRFFSMASARNRIIGIQMYKYNIVGFLHWGYNFYYTQFSVAKIDPYTVTDAGEAFPSGDSFSVYPYGNDVIPSLRQKVFSNALEDMRLLLLLENKIGHEAVVALIERVAGMTVTFTEYPKDNTFFDRLYAEIFKELEK